MTTSAKVTIHVYDTPAEIFSSLAVVFPPAEQNDTRWVAFDSTTGHHVVFFASPETPTAAPEEVVS